MIQWSDKINRIDKPNTVYRTATTSKNIYFYLLSNEVKWREIQCAALYIHDELTYLLNLF